MPDEKRIKDFEPATDLLIDDWFAVDSPSQGTRKMQASMFQQGLQTQITANAEAIALHSGQITTLQQGVGNLGDRVDVLDAAITTDAYSASSTYAVNDYCIYDNVMYKCITAIETPEAFTPSHWQATSIEGEINELNSSLEYKSVSNLFSIKSAYTSLIAINNQIAYRVGNIIYVYLELHKIGTIANGEHDIIQCSVNPKIVSVFNKFHDDYGLIIQTNGNGKFQHNTQVRNWYTLSGYILV